jgi:hypothetical protein
MSKPWTTARWCLAGVGLTLLGLGGCQTWTAGMTLPSPRYLQHPPQYFPPSPPFPLSRELASQEIAAGVSPGIAVGQGGVAGSPIGAATNVLPSGGAPPQPIVPQAGQPPMPGPGPGPGLGR